MGFDEGLRCAVNWFIARESALAMRSVDAGPDVVGYEVDGSRMERFTAAETYVEDVPSRVDRGAGHRPARASASAGHRPVRRCVSADATRLLPTERTFR